MPLSEIIATDSGHLYGEENYAARGIEVHSNNTDEILSFAIEMNARLNDHYLETEEEKNIQTAFKEKVSAVDIVLKPNGTVRCKLSSSFVKANSYFLQD